LTSDFFTGRKAFLAASRACDTLPGMQATVTAKTVGREFILREIRRTAEANGGTPLGSRGFFNETGIPVAAWHGKFWARWSDALVEAGFSPNQLQAPFDTDALLAKYAGLAQELGRLPSVAELRLKRHADRTYPDSKVFERLGTKAELVQMVLDYCRRQTEFADVITLCEAYVPRDQAGSSDGPAHAGVDGCVYLAKSGRHYKIGRSAAVGRREYELAIQLPQRLKMIHVIRTDDPSGIEAYWHRRFEAKHTNGEWFELDSQDVAAFKRRKFM
jgi:hypothetical protein